MSTLLTAKDLQHLCSVEGRKMTGSSLKKAASLLSQMQGKVIPMGVGRPTSNLYPWNALSMQEASLLHSKVSTAEVKTQTIPIAGSSYNLATALNYGTSQGSPELIKFLSEHVATIHNPPYTDWNIALTCGSSSAFEIALRIFCDRGDTLLMEEHTYPGAIEAAALVGVQTQSIRMDSNGLQPECLEETLRLWDHSKGPRPWVLYTIPSGQNPTGATLSLERRRAIYRIAEEYDLVIIEDDPYFFLQLGGRSERQSNQDLGASASECPTTEYLNALLPSFVSLDCSGRVVRLDSTSKILAPGLRAGWVTASTQIVSKFVAFHEFTTVHVAGPTQAMLWSLLCQSWGQQGFLNWLQDLSREYRLRRDTVIEACEEYLPSQICEWKVPECGMFLWISLKWREHPSVSSKIIEIDTARAQVAREIQNIEDRLVAKAFHNGVQVTGGSLFTVDKILSPALHIRLTYAAASEAQLTEGVRKFAEAVEEEFRT